MEFSSCSFLRCVCKSNSVAFVQTVPVRRATYNFLTRVCSQAKRHTSSGRREHCKFIARYCRNLCEIDQKIWEGFIPKPESSERLQRFGNRCWAQEAQPTKIL